jgi:hypothetical protein
MLNRLVHAYLDVDLEIVWNTVLSAPHWSARIKMTIKWANGAGEGTRTLDIQLGRNGVKQPLTHKDFRARMTEDTKTSGCSIRAE